MAVKSHIQIAAEQGMKAGYNAYMQQLGRSGLPQVQARLAELQGMSRRKRFSTYCAQVGPDVTAYTQAQNAPVTIPVVEVAAETPKALAQEIAEARARLAELESQAKAEAQPRPKIQRSTPKAEVKENLWREWAVRKHNIPAKVGATFTYKGKRRTSTFKVTRITSEGVYTTRA